MSLYSHKAWKYYNPKIFEVSTKIDVLQNKICELLADFKSKIPEELRKKVEWWEGEIHEVIEEMREDLIKEL